jgi:hypothetical protein
MFFAHEAKYSDKWDSYLDVYERVLGDLRNKSINILEIGVQNGGSLEIWDKYFPNSIKVLGCDINPHPGSFGLNGSRI